MLVVLVNGKDATVSESATLETLAASYRLKAEAVVAELNGAIVARERWGQTVLSSGDRVELVTFVGGGD